MAYTLWLNQVSLENVSLVGGKNASLGEMIQNLNNLNIRVPNGFVITAAAYQEFIAHNNLNKYISREISKINYDQAGVSELRKASENIKERILRGVFPDGLISDILEKYKELGNADVAVRSSSTAEDMPDASFAGQQDTFLGVIGENQLLESIKKCFASLYNERAIDYRHNLGYDSSHIRLSLSVCVQKMVRSDLACAGVAFSLDTESGNRNVVVINSSYGLGESVVSGQVQPDEFIVFKPKLLEGYKAIIDKKLGKKTTQLVYNNDNSDGNNHKDSATLVVPVPPEKEHQFSLTDNQIVELARCVMSIESHYGTPVDVEWAVDGNTGEMFIVQARPETVHSRADASVLTRYSFDMDVKKERLLSGVAVGSKIASGNVRILTKAQFMAGVQIVSDGQESGVTGLSCKTEPAGLTGPIGFRKGDILVTQITDPDWEPLMKIAGAIVTEKGGRTCHAAIVARELGVPAVVGAVSADHYGACQVLRDGQSVTVSCGEGETGFVYNGRIPYEVTTTDFNGLAAECTGEKGNSVKIMMNVASPENAFNVAKLPNFGVGLAREEFIINNFIKIHPLAIIKPESVSQEVRDKITEITRGYDKPVNFFVDKLSFGIARIASAFYPHPVIVRFSDFKSNEYINLLGGTHFEPHEENPMIGWRGAARYYSEKYEAAFGLECQAIKKVREEMGLKNVVVMIPFCRTVMECQSVLNTMAKYGLQRGIHGLEVFLMCEIPANCILADDFCKLVDGFSIGSNDLTQLTLGLDRDSELVQHIYNERNPAVKALISMAIKACKRNGVKIGICGSAPSDFPDFAKFLIDEGIDTISLTSDAVIKTIQSLRREK